MRLYFMVLADREDGTPAPGYLVQTTSLEGRAPVNVLIDSGFPDSMIGRIYSGWRITPQAQVLTQLASIGLKPGDIDLLIATHMDPDHAGNHNAFPRATVICQRAHFQWASRHEHVRTGGPGARWAQPQIRWQLVEGDTDVASGVRVIESPGHVPGHQSVLVTLPTQKYLLAIDAIPRTSQLNPDTRHIGAFDMDEAAVRASTRKLRDLAGREGAQIICGHDAAQWRELTLLPASYT
jgi:N-acyl homoserine lactone hydrolase